MRAFCNKKRWWETTEGQQSVDLSRPGCCDLNLRTLVEEIYFV